MALAFAAAAAPAGATGTGLIFVSNEKSHDISVLDPQSLEIVKSIPTSRRPRDMKFNADKRSSTSPAGTTT